MKKIITALSCLIPLAASAGTMGELVKPFPWFASIGTGYSWSSKPGIDNPDPATWDFANEGYNGALTNAGFYSFALGKQVHQYIDLSVSYLNNEDFNFQHFQTGVSATPSFTGAERTRFFTLNNRAVMANITLHDENPLLSPYSIDITPFVSGGIGAGFNKVTDFHTVGSVALPTATIASTTSIGAPTSHTGFAWQGSVGINVQPQASHLSANIGYRYYNGGDFEGPAATYSAADGFLVAAPWKGTLKTNQMFVEFKYTV